MSVDTSSLFSQVIQDHLELKQKNADLEPQLPLDRYKNDDPFDNHPLFKTEEQARLEETMDGEPAIQIEPITLKWPGEDGDEPAAADVPETHDSLWSRSRDFDWGD